MRRFSHYLKKPNNILTFEVHLIDLIRLQFHLMNTLVVYIIGSINQNYVMSITDEINRHRIMDNHRIQRKTQKSFFYLLFLLRNGLNMNTYM